MDGSGGASIDLVGVLLALVAAAAQVVFITISRNGYRSVPTETATLVVIGTSMVGGALLAVLVGQGTRWSRRSGPWRRGRPCCSPASRRRGSRRCCS